MIASTGSGWSIEGSDAIASALRAAARYVPAAAPVTILVNVESGASDAFALGSSALRTSAERVVPLESAFEAVETMRTAVASGEAGRVHGCFTSFRLPRDADAKAVVDEGLLPALAMTLDVVSGEPGRVWAQRSSLFGPDDAWFVTIRMTDETLLTIEAMASERQGSERSILVELTASEQVIRAEPTRQAVIIESFDDAPRFAPWWEDLCERYLHLVQQRASLKDDASGSRLRAVWNAVHESATTGEPVSISG